MALHEIDQDLKAAEGTLSHWANRYPELIRREATAKIAYEVAWAEAVDGIHQRAALKGDKLPTVAVLEAEATQKCKGELAAKRSAEAEVEIAKKLIGIAETTSSLVQSRLKLESLEMGLAR